MPYEVSAMITDRNFLLASINAKLASLASSIKIFTANIWLAMPLDNVLKYAFLSQWLEVRLEKKYQSSTLAEATRSDELSLWAAAVKLSKWKAWALVVAFSWDDYAWRRAMKGRRIKQYRLADCSMRRPKAYPKSERISPLLSMAAV